MTRKFITSVLSLTAVLSITSGHAHEGHNSSVPWQACDGKRLDAPCEYSNTAQDLYRGTCREVKQQLLCVRNQPIVKGYAEGIGRVLSLDASTSAPIGERSGNTFTF